MAGTEKQQKMLVAGRVGAATVKDSFKLIFWYACGLYKICTQNTVARTRRLFTSVSAHRRPGCLSFLARRQGP